MTGIFEIGTIGAVGIIGYFLKDIHSRAKDNQEKFEEQALHFVEELGKLKGKFELIEQKVGHNEEKMQLKIEQLTKEVGALTKVIQKLVDQK